MSAERTLGPITERRFEEVFKDTALATAKAICGLLGLDEDTLKDMTDDGVIKAVRKGRCRSYTEHDVRAYLLEGPDAPRREARSKPAHVSPSKIVPFSRRKA